MAGKKNTSKPNSVHNPLNINDEDVEKEMLKPFRYHTKIHGKRLRENLIKVLEHWVTVPKEKLEKIDKIVSSVHNGTLLLDDIQDYSVLRRGIPTAYTIFGIARTVIAVDWSNSTILDLLTQLDNIELTKCYLKTMQLMFAGQGMEVYWRDNCVCPTEAEYLQMIYRKTSLVFLLAQKAVNFLSADKQVDTDKLLTAFGMYFQINDDYQNLHSQVYFDSKGFCEDISEGKFSFPIVHAINNCPEKGQIIIDILSQRTYDVGLKKRCLSILEECGSFDYTRKKLEELKKVVHEEIAKLDETPNPLMKEYIQTAMQLSL